MRNKNKKEETEEPINPYHKEYGLANNIKYVINAIKKYSKTLLWLIPVGFVITIVNRYLGIFLSKYVVDIIAVPNSQKKLIIIVSAFSLVMLIFYFIQTIYQNKQTVECMIVRLRLVLEKNWITMTMPFQGTEDPDVLDCAQKADNAISGSWSGVEGMEHEILRFFEQIGVVICGLFILGTMNKWIVLLMTILAIINFLISNKANIWAKKNIWDALAGWWRKRWYMNIALSDFSYAKDIRMYGLKDWLTQRFNEINVERYDFQRKNNKLWFYIGILNSFMWLVSQVLIYGYLIYSVYLRSITIGSFILYVGSAGTFFGTVSQILATLDRLLQRSREVDDFRSFIDFKAEDELSKLEVPEYEKYEFEFVNVSFKYPRAKRYALENVNMKINAGERLAVVGLNGAGKSTFIKLLLRLYEPTEGKILLNGVDISTYKKDSYYKIFSPVFQEVNLFAMTLSENVAMKEPVEIDRKVVEECVNGSGLDTKLNRMPQGIDTQLLKIIYEEGVDMSGGEKQKLALARALYKNAPVVVLDEPTAALDALAESKLYQDFDKLIGGKTSVYISHRLSSTQFCNNIAMFKDGKMIEYGTHKQLMELKGEYERMFRIQSQYYLEDKE